MSEPHSTSVGAVVGAAISAPTLLLGAQADALVIGLMSAVLASFWMETIDNKLKAGSAVLASALLAGYGSPVAAGLVADAIPAAAHSAEPLRMLMAVVIGCAAPRLVPRIFSFAERWLAGWKS